MDGLGKQRWCTVCMGLFVTECAQSWAHSCSRAGGTDRGLLAERVGNALRLAALEYYAAALDCAAAPLDYAAAARGQNHTTQAQAAISGGAGARQVPNP